jgi:hypothetical protein
MTAALIEEPDAARVVAKGNEMLAEQFDVHRITPRLR